jgi:hypothetical protein
MNNVQPERFFAEQLNELYQQVLSPLEGSNWALVSHETAQYKEYLSKLKFTLTELNSKEAFLAALYSGEPVEKGEANNDLVKQQLKSVKKQIEQQENILRSTYDAVQGKLAEQQQKISLLAELSAKCSDLRQKNEHFRQ